MRRLAIIGVLLFPLFLFAQSIDQKWVETNYKKTEYSIPMRDGVELYTAVYEPVSVKDAPPIILTRTPYRSTPYGMEMSNKLWSNWSSFAREKYIFVFQDVRGKGMSGGTFVNVRPYIPNKQGKQIDEASDVYDSVEWLLAHLKKHNGNVAILGSSYPGFYAFMGGLSAHPAIKAIVPQAPVVNWFMGDDFHHNGALMLTDGFRFNASFNRPSRPYTIAASPAPTYYTTDEYSFFLRMGALKNITRLFGDSIRFWNEMMAHPHLDEWWKQRDVSKHCANVKPAVLVVGGLFDAEDCYGTFELYKAIRKQSPETLLSLVIGPWSHGAWNSKDASSLGYIHFGANTAQYYQQEIEFPFVQAHVKPHVKSEISKGKSEPFVQCFISGENAWKTYTQWPPKETDKTPFYLMPDGYLSCAPPVFKTSSSGYLSDPRHPVPYTDRIQTNRPKEYMVDDQRFAERRPDVLTFRTDVLAEDLFVSGAPQVELWVSSNTTDADFVVKIIDEFPEDITAKKSAYPMSGYQMLVRGDVMRARFRNSFERPQALKANAITKIAFPLCDISHKFSKGHRLMVQVQSSWFPLIDRNPQQFVSIQHCSDADFIPAKIKIFHQAGAASKLILPVQRLRAAIIP